MEWLDTIAVHPTLQQAEVALEGVQPTNPSSLSLALIGAGTYLLFGWGRRTTPCRVESPESGAEETGAAIAHRSRRCPLSWCRRSLACRGLFRLVG